MKKLIFLLLPLFIPLKAMALELLLEENRGESGTIGYVDIDRVFKEYSGTSGAREEFLAEIKRKEDAVNSRKNDIFSLKAEIAKLRQEREFALTLPSLMETRRSVEAVVAKAADQEPAPSTGAAQAFLPSTLPQTVSTSAAQAMPLSLAVSSPAAQAMPLSLAVSSPAAQAVPLPPAVSTSAAQAMPLSPAVSTPAIQAVPLPKTAGQGAQPAQLSTSAAASPQPAASPALPGMEGIDMPGIPRVPISHFKFSVSTSVPEIDAVLTKKEDELKTKEDDLRAFQKQSEKELLDYESHRSEIILGRIYTALKELAVKEEVSVIVDKRNILYGQNAVDLTDKLLKKLEAGGI